MALSLGILFGAGRAVPIALSAMAHVAVAGALITSAGHARVAPPGPLAEVTLESVAEPAPEPAPVPDPAPVPNVAAQAASHAPPTHTHPYPVPEDHDTHPHDPSLDHHHAEAAEPAAAEPAVTSDAPMPRFTIAIGNAPEAHGAVGGTALVATQAVAGDTTYADAQVSRRAQLVASAVAAYPPAARTGDLEADVPLEIVVDASGTVVDARVVTRTGSGFDESALAAIRRYRFSPAMRDGKPVRVRMRWSVQFRLR